MKGTREKVLEEKVLEEKILLLEWERRVLKSVIRCLGERRVLDGIRKVLNNGRVVEKYYFWWTIVLLKDETVTCWMQTQEKYYEKQAPQEVLEVLVQRSLRVLL